MVATSIALAIVMGGIQKQSLPDILPYIMAGILCFYLPGYVLTEAPEVYMSSSNIIKNHAYPFTYYAFESVTRVFLVFLHNLVAYYLAMAILTRLAIPDWTILPALVLVYCNCLVWGTLASMVAARFRDLRFLLPFMSQIIFFMTPVFWHPNNMDGWRVWLVRVNPFYGLMEIVRSPLLGTTAPSLAWELSAASLIIGSLLWLFFFSRFRSKIPFWI